MDTQIPTADDLLASDAGRQAGGAARRGVVLVVDDEAINTYVIRVLLTENGYRAIEANSGEKAVEILGQQPVEVVICDIRMPRMDGEQVLRHVLKNHPSVPVIMLTGFIDVASAVNVMRMGAADYLTKPIDASETLMAVERAFVKRRDSMDRQRLETENRKYQAELERVVDEKTRELHQNTLALVMAMAGVAEERDPFRRGRAKRVARDANQLGRALALPETDRRRLYQASFLFELGMVAIPDEVRFRREPLSELDRQRIREHPLRSVSLLEGVQPLWDVLPAIRHHMEWWDGSGYPEGISGETIPLLARILGLVGAFDALLSTRPHRVALSGHQALEVLESLRGRQFDPRLVDEFRPVARARAEERDARPPDSSSATTLRPPSFPPGNGGSPHRDPGDG